MSEKFEKQYDALGLKAPEGTMDARNKAEVIFHAACKKLGIDPSLAPPVFELLDKYQAPIASLYRLMIIRDAITDNREANWDDRSEYKYEGWFLLNAPGFRFRVAYYLYSSSGVGSRLCTFSEADAEFFMTECIAFWADFLGGKLPG